MALLRLLVAISLCLLPSLAPVATAEVRVKDIARIQGVRENEIFGYGLVVGLNGTGDRSGSSPFTPQTVANMLLRMGINVPRTALSLKNVAAVVVTAKLQPFARTGTSVDVLVSSIGDATSLQGGTLLLTPLQGGDGKVYAVAQGPVSVGGFQFIASGTSETVQKNHPTVGRVPGGATIEREVPMSLNPHGVTVTLSQPDFTTAARLSQAVNGELGGSLARALDPGTVTVSVPADYRERLVEFVAKVENARLETDAPAKVVINERTGTIIMGSEVRILAVAVSHGNLSIHIKSEFQVSQPQPFAPLGSATVTVPQTQTTVKEEKGNLILLPEGASIGEVVKALNAIGATPRDLIAILQAIKQAGALQAALEIM
jgi:flagellar P-ring protein precursor FlgI